MHRLFDATNACQAHSPQCITLYGSRQRSFSLAHQRKHLTQHVVGKEKAATTTLRCSPLHLFRRIDPSIGHHLSYCMLQGPSQLTVTVSRSHRWTTTVWPRLATRNYTGLGNNLNCVHHVRHRALQDVLDQYALLFKEGMGTLQGTTVKIHVQLNARPRLFRARPVPYAL